MATFWKHLFFFLIPHCLPVHSMSAVTLMLKIYPHTSLRIAVWTPRWWIKWLHSPCRKGKLAKFTVVNTLKNIPLAQKYGHGSDFGVLVLRCVLLTETNSTGPHQLADQGQRDTFWSGGPLRFPLEHLIMWTEP